MAYRTTRSISSPEDESRKVKALSLVSKAKTASPSAENSMKSISFDTRPKGCDNAAMEQPAFVCRDCGRTLPLESLAFRCDCGGLLDLAPFDARFDPDGAERSVFRYASSMPPFLSGGAVSGAGAGARGLGREPWRRVTMGEGLTPLLPLDPADPRLLVKVDYAMPTLSFKDRGAAVVVAGAVAAGARRLIQDSSGNAGAAMAAYAARAGLPCGIFVPDSTSPGKIAQIEAFGARVVRVPGSREATAAAALDAAENGPAGTMYASHVYNPLFYQGTKTYLFEIFEALGGILPDTLYLPLGNGTLVLGAAYGMEDLLRLGLIDRPARIVAVQAEGCAPIYRAWSAGAEDVEPVANEGTAAEGIAVAAPRRGAQVLAELRRLGGEVVLAPEAGIQAAATAIAARGFHVETTGAATFAALFARAAAGADEGRVVVPLCGAGLKSLH